MTERGTSILLLNSNPPKGVRFYIYKMEPGARSPPTVKAMPVAKAPARS